MSLRSLFPVNTALARPLVPVLIRLKVSANAITLLSLLCGLVAGTEFSRGTTVGMVSGALGFLLANLMDECDGTVARQTNTASRLGTFLDTAADCVVHVALFLGLGIGLSRQQPDGPWWLLGMVAAAGSILSFALDVGGITPWQAPSSMASSPRETWAWIIESLRIDFSLLVLLSAFLGSVGWILWAGTLGVFLFWIPSTFFIAAQWSRLKLSFRWMGLLVGLALFFWILKTQDLHAVWRHVQNLNWRFGWILLFYIVIFGLDTWGWRFALGSKVRVRWDRLFRTRLAGEAINYVTPTAWIGGEPVKAHLLSKRYGVPLEEGMASVVVAKTTFSISMFFFIVTGLLVTQFLHPVDLKVWQWVWIVLPVLGLLLGLFLLVQFFAPFQRGISAVRWVAPEWIHKIESKLQKWDQAIVSVYRQSPKAVLLSFTFHFLGWVAGALEVLLILTFLQIPVSLATAWSIESLWLLLKSGAFLIPASLGASESLALLICKALGIGPVAGLALALIRRARELLWVSLGLIEFSRG